MMAVFQSPEYIGLSGPDLYKHFNVKNGKYASHGLVTNLDMNKVGIVDKVLDIKEGNSWSELFIARSDGSVSVILSSHMQEVSTYGMFGLDYLSEFNSDTQEWEYSPGEVRNGYTGTYFDSFMKESNFVRYGEPSTRKPVSAMWAQNERHRHLVVGQFKWNASEESDQAIIGNTDTFPVSTADIVIFRRKSDKRWFIRKMNQFNYGSSGAIELLPSEFDGKDKSEIFVHQNFWCTHIGGSNYLFYKTGGSQKIVTLNSPLSNIRGSTQFDTRDYNTLCISGIRGPGQWSVYVIDSAGDIQSDEYVILAPTDNILSDEMWNSSTNSFSKSFRSFTVGDKTYTIGMGAYSGFRKILVADTPGYRTTGSAKTWVSSDMKVFGTPDNPHFYAVGDPGGTFVFFGGTANTLIDGPEAYSGKYEYIHTLKNHNDWKVVPTTDAYRYYAMEQQIFAVKDGSECHIYSCRTGFKREESDWTIESKGELCIVSGYEYMYRVSGDDAGVVNRFRSEFWNSAENDGVSIDDMGRMYRAPSWSGLRNQSEMSWAYGRIHRDLFPSIHPKFMTPYEYHWGAEGRFGAVWVYNPNTGHRGFYQDGYYWHAIWYEDFVDHVDRFDPDYLFTFDTWGIGDPIRGYGYAKFDRYGNIHDVWFADRDLASKFGMSYDYAEDIVYSTMKENYGLGSGIFFRRNGDKAFYGEAIAEGDTAETLWVFDPKDKSITKFPHMKIRQFSYEPDSKFLPKKPSPDSVYARPFGNFPPTSEEVNEEFFLETRAHSTSGSGVSTAATIPAGDTVTVTVHGNWNNWGYGGTYHGAPDAQIYPSPSGNASVNTIRDAESVYSWPAIEGNPSLPYHYQGIYVNAGSGWVHPTPVGGHPSGPSPNHFYTYNITGQGQKLRFAISDAPLSDNHGRYKITVSGTINPNAQWEDYYLWSMKAVMEHPLKDDHILVGTQDFNILEYKTTESDYPTTIYIDRISQDITGEEYIATMCPHPTDKNLIAFTMGDYNVRIMDVQTGEYTAVENGQLVERYPDPYPGDAGRMFDARYRYMFDYGQMFPLENPCRPTNSQKVESVKVDLDYGDDLPIDWWRW